MRIGTAHAYNATVESLNGRQSSLGNLQQQLSSGKKVILASDDPAAAGRAERAKTRIERLQTEQRALMNQRNSLQQAESALGQGGSVLQSARDAILSAGNPALSRSDRASLAAAVRGMREQLLSIANQSDANGVPLFGGLGSIGAPFVASASGVQFAGAAGQMSPSQSNVPYAMDGQNLWMSVPGGNGVFTTSAAAGNTGAAWADPGQVEDPSLLTGHNYEITFTQSGTTTSFSVQDTTTGSTVLPSQPYVPGQALRFDGLAITAKGAPADGDRLQIAPSTRGDLFAVLERAANAIETGAPSLAGDIARATTELDTGMDRLLAGRSLAGAWLNRADTMESIQLDQSTQHEQARSLAEDIDMVRGISDLQTAQSGLDAAMRTYSQIQGLSLFKYLGG